MNAEQILLGQMIQSKHVYFSSNLTDDHFSPGLHRDAFRAIRDRYEAGSDVDLILLRSDLPQWSAAEVAALTDSVPSAANWKFYVQEIEKKHTERALKKLAREVDEIASDPAAIEMIYERLGTMQDPSHAEVFHAPQMVMEYMEVAEELYKNRGKLPGISTGFERLDNLIMGLQPRRLYYIGARPSDGKTALLLCLLANAARQGCGVGMLSLESSRRELMSRLYSITSGMDNRALQTGYMKTSDFARLTEASSTIHDWNMTVFDFENMPLSVLRAKAREMVRVHGAKVLFVDYIQLVKQVDMRQPFRIHMNEVSQTLKAIARELEVPVVCAAQLGRDAQDRQPHLSDFKESGQIEQDADVAILLWHEDEGTADERSHLIIAKNRDGAKGSVPVVFVRNKMRFEPLMEGNRNDILNTGGDYE